MLQLFLIFKSYNECFINQIILFISIIVDCSLDLHQLKA